MKNLIKEIKKCQLCAQQMSVSPRPVLSVTEQSKILIIGQAPGSVVYNSGVPWADKSGENLRSWMNISQETFYDNKKFGILPMGFCYPGKGKTGDLPPRKECAPQWHSRVFAELTEVKLTLLIGKYAQEYYLKDKKKKTLTETVRQYDSYLPQFFVLPHPSPRNNIWMKKNPWFRAEVIPQLQKIVHQVI